MLIFLFRGVGMGASDGTITFIPGQGQLPMVGVGR